VGTTAKRGQCRPVVQRKTEAREDRDQPGVRRMSHPAVGAPVDNSLARLHPNVDEPHSQQLRNLARCATCRR